ncbi:molybdenum cofactor guanylyltransferase MobA [Macrococcus armenti]|uniref:molybdenum cofactor guanylyltransferase MobA n=1 Tax=Macrococcus armenti TaxID=2875764 RepID=UPI001CCAFCC3|nr:molybdenum cofactor guanylyltransferase MobA [Macrococcus armenti]UBH08746.1 molybdenum cofactor guanylyltransferase MobA [Macrococcus armenti]UBH11043.1 molybdenum cofactor guanylyltransferase MobA [Macrococcus armenti]UBH15522.1 molybdenum cofactor guanylyltransferase MobA [Macrococcus armenti]UBH17882.1 molybdenum cofactor guanylyltransferase MobA [Macrococcus armenti]UBH20148.1 molybdenum cofactor guanylyltransferase MobA [Macrococcus armenti]
MIGVILAGGASTRFGSNKALHKIDGKPFYEHVYEAFKESDVSRIVLSTNKQMTSYFELEIKEKQLDMHVVTDIEADCGPMSGIYTVMETIASESYFVVSVDTPFITTEAINYLISCFNTRSVNVLCYKDNLQVHRTIAIYHRSLLPVIRESIGQKRYALKQLTAEAQFIPVSEVSEESEWYANINTKNDLQNVRRVTNGTNNR